MRTAVLSIPVLVLLAGCTDPSERDPGPLAVTASAFRLLEDEFNVEWVLEFRNQGALPITRLETATVHGSLYDGASFTIHGTTYDQSADVPVERQKFGGPGRPIAPASLNERPSHLFPRGTTLAPGESLTLAVRLYFDHINYTKPEGSGWLTFEQAGGKVNATDFYHLSLTAEYAYQDYGWNTEYAVSCFTPDGQRIELVPPPHGVCDDPSGLLNRNAPKWERHQG